MKTITFRKQFDTPDTAAEAAQGLKMMHIGGRNQGLLAQARKVGGAFWVYITISGTHDGIAAQNDLAAYLPGFIRVS